MAKTLSNVVRFIVDSLQIMDTALSDGVTTVATCTSATANTFVCTGLNVALNALAGMDIVVYSGTGAPAIRTITSNAATSAGSTTITVGANWAVNPTAGALAQIAPSATWVNIGLADESPITIELKNEGAIPFSDGSTAQKGYALSITAKALQVLDVATIEAYRNKWVWIKTVPVGSTHTLIIRNALINVEASLDLSVKGKSGVDLTAKEFIQNYGDMIVVA